MHLPSGMVEISVLWEGEERSWLVGCFGFNGPLRQYFSLYRTVTKKET